MAGISIQARFSRLICHREGSSWRKTEPYLWTLFFKIDGSTVKLSERFELEGEAVFHHTAGSHGNLGVLEMRTGEEVVIPAKIGVWQTTLEPIPVPFFNYEIPGIIGMVAVLMEKENVSAAGAEAGHQALNTYVEKAVNEALTQFDVKQIDVENIQASIKAYFSEQVGQFEAGIEKAVTDAVIRSQNVFQNLWSLLDRDDLIGYEVWDLDQDLLQAEGKFDIQKRWTDNQTGDWELRGEILTDGLVPPTTSPVQIEIED
ncbi:MAG: hypothetical protein AAFV07_10180 [Bacteroidota bacterium]